MLFLFPRGILDEILNLSQFLRFFLPTFLWLFIFEIIRTHISVYEMAIMFGITKLNYKVCEQVFKWIGFSVLMFSNR